MTPKELADLADAYFKTKLNRLDADKTAAKLKTEEEGLKAKLMAYMQEHKLTAIGGNLIRITMDTEPEYVPAVTDWNVFRDFVLSSKDLSLLERRVSKSAVKERWELNAEVPGVGKLPVYKLHTSIVKG